MYINKWFLVLPLSFSIAFGCAGSQKNVRNSGDDSWSSERDDLRGEIARTMETEFATMDFSAPLLSTITDCITDKSIQFLNASSCPNDPYDPASGTEAEHEGGKMECLNRIGFEAATTEAALQCLRTLIPDDWNILRPVFAVEFEKAFLAQNIPKEGANKIGLCVSVQLPVLLNGRECLLINRGAQRAEDLFFNTDTCIAAPSTDIEFQTILKVCASAAAEDRSE